MKVVKKILMGLMLIFTVLSSAACEAKSNSKGKKMEILNGKDGLYAVLETEKGKECIAEFDRVLPDYKGISQIKKIDSILWSIR